MYNSSTEIRQTHNGTITLQAGSTVVSGSMRVLGVIRVSGNPNIISPGDGFTAGLQTDGYASITLNGTQGNSGYIDFSTNGVDFYTRILGRGNPNIMEYFADTHSFMDTDGSDAVTLRASEISPSQTLTVNSARQIRTRIGGSSTIYNASSETGVPTTSWTSINWLYTLKSKGNGNLNWNGQWEGFVNQTGQSILVSVTFSCQRKADGFGITALRILAGGAVLGVQDVSALDAVSISGQAYLDNLETIDCQIFHNAPAACQYHRVYISINTYPLPL
jgi:hypothetical protein